jgi:adenylate cyclase
LGIEVERKFLVRNDEWRECARGTHYRQGFLSTDPDRTVRVRASEDRGWLTVKGRTRGATRAEFEYEIPLDDATELLDRVAQRPLIEKTRYLVEASGLTWEVDVFEGENEGLVVAEVELPSEDEDVVKPAWCGEEVTGDPRYYNANLVAHPFSAWRGEP